MGKLKAIICTTALSVLLCACATVHQPEIVDVPAKPVISPTVAQKSELNKSSLKRKVAIARFSDETKYGQSFFLDKNQDRIGKQAVDILSAKMLETGKFILLERADLEKINQELQMENYSPLKNMADFLIVGSITEFGRKDQGKVGIFSRTKRQVAFAKVHIRMIDVRTGQIVYSEEGQGEASSEAGSIMGVGERAGYDSSLNDKALDAAITNLASNVIENLLDKPWRSYILGQENGKLLIAGGTSQNIKPGELFKIMKEGTQVKNPQTNMMIRLPGKEIGTIRTEMSIGEGPANEITYASIESGDLKKYIAANDFSSLYIEEK